MENIELLNIFDREERMREASSGANSKGEFRIIHVVIPDETNADSEIETQLAYSRALNMGLEWKVYSYDRPAYLRERLKVHGF